MRYSDSDVNRFSTNSYFCGTDPRERGRQYAEKCENLLDWNLISITTIHACVLLGAIAITNGKAASESVHYAVACRIAQLLDIPNCQASSRVEQEINIRSKLATRFIMPSSILTKNQLGGH